MEEFKGLAAVALNLKKPDEIYTSTVDGVIFQSADGGMIWKRQ